jgi:hypothetical protein
MADRPLSIDIRRPLLALVEVQGYAVQAMTVMAGLLHRTGDAVCVARGTASLRSKRHGGAVKTDVTASDGVGVSVT